jgi:hypothetical protein
VETVAGNIQVFFRGGREHENLDYSLQAQNLAVP